MKIAVDDRLRREAESHAFRFACEDCLHATTEADPGSLRCSLGYPPAPRRSALDTRYLVLCKTFELA